MISILLVDDQPDIISMAKKLLDNSGDAIVKNVSSAEEALKLLKKKDFDIIISAYNIHGMDGIGLLKAIRGQGKDVPVIIYGSKVKDGTALDALRSGAEFFLQISKDPGSQFTELRYVVEEIVKRKRAEDALRRREKDFRALVNKNADAMMVLDKNGVIRYANPASLTLFNLPESELQGKVLGFPVVLKEPVDMYIIRGYREFVAAEMRIVEVEWDAEPSYLISFRDVTGHVRHEEELSDARDELEVRVLERTYELETANNELRKEIENRSSMEEELRAEIEERSAAQDRLYREVEVRAATEKALAEANSQAELYLDLMGHDINNLNQVGIGYLELAMGSTDLEEVKSMIEKPLEAMREASRIIENVRKLKQISLERPDTDIAVKVINLCDILPELKEHYMKMTNRDITINIQSPNLCFVKANDLIVDVFSNLIDNAVKHSGSMNPLTINVKIERIIEKKQYYYRCMVEDNGPGVPDWIKDKIFLRFQRGSTKAHGKGLGLYLIKKLVEGYHGAVWVEDRIPGVYNKGAKFIVMLPAAE
jgi:signal transduction histidine kinase